MVFATLLLSALLAVPAALDKPEETSGRAAQALFSDEFGGPALDARWRFVNPLGDATATLAGGRLRIALPAGPNHNAWYPTSTVPRLLQDAPNTDFTLEAKFDGALTQSVQGHGLIVEETPTRFLRFDLYRRGGQTYAFAALITPGGASTRANRAVASSAPSYVRVERTGARWRFFTSTNGSSWTEVAAFDQALQVTAAGVMAGNYGGDGPAPAYTAQVDYFRTSALPPGGGDGPALAVWHGDRQRVGHLGDAQDDFNVVGTVSDPDGVASLTYRLNGGAARSLTVGDRPDGFGDGRRLAATGDFNADIPVSQLQMGANTVVLTATGNGGAVTTETVTIERQRGSAPFPASIDWGSVTDPQEAGQYVDGQWSLQGSGLRTVRTGYDRLFLIGERSWQDYEITAPVTLHRLDAELGPRSGSTPIVGFVLRFAGHVVGGPLGYPEAQPKWGYLPFGGLGYIRYKGNNAYQRELFRGDSNVTYEFGERETINLGDTVWMKMRCKTLPDAPDGRGVTRYSFKMWANGQPEPAGWDWEFDQTSQHALRQGGVALVAHHADVTFGDVTITPLAGGPPDTTPPALSGITADPAATAAAIRWTTDEPATSAVAFGPTSAYERGTAGTSSLATAHAVALTGLAPETTYHYRVTSADGSGNAASSSDRTFTTPAGGSAPPTGFSDEFGGPALDARWRFVNPLNDAAATLAEGQLRIALPDGPNHDAWYPSSTAPRVLQNIPDAPFTVEAKVDGAFTQSIQGHGLVAEASDGRFVRFDLYRSGGQTYAYAAVVTPSAAFTRANRAVASGEASAWLRMERAGTRWTLRHSADGANWTDVAAFDQALPVSAVGVMAGNYGGSGPAPAHTAQVDYFRSLPPETSAPAAASALAKAPLDAAPLGAAPSAGGVVLSWRPDLPASAFAIERSATATPGGDDFEVLATVPVARYQTEPYTYRVAGLPPGAHRFRLKLLDADAVRYSQTATVEVGATPPFALTAPRPNPFSATATFSLTVAETQRVRIEAYNVLGQRVERLFDDVLASGAARVFRLEGEDLPSGLYFIRVRGEHFTAAHKALLTK